MTAKELIAAILKKVDESGLTKQDFAKKHGFAHSTVYRWRSESRMPSLDKFCEIARSTGFDVVLKPTGEENNK